MVPAGLSRSSLSAATPPSMSAKAGPIVRSRRSPASVRATLRVVRGEQAQPEPGFQPAHRMAERRLRGGELRRRPREAALLRHRHERQQVAGFLPLHS